MENILKKLTPLYQEYINNSIRKETYKKGEIIHRTDEECKGLITVLSGQMRTYIVSEEGREVTLFRVNSGEVCVLSVSCLMQSITFDVIIEATEDTEISVIPANVVNKVMNENPQVELYLYKAAVDKFSEVMWTMQQILFLKIDQRVAQFLWDEITRKGTATLHITHDEIARYIGSAREVVTKVMKYLSKEKIVELKRGTIEIVDKDKLQKIAM